MTRSTPYNIVLLKSVNLTMWADRILKEKGIPHKLVPMPRHISHDCGVCIRVDSGLAEHVRSELGTIIEDMKIIPLVPA